MRKLALGVLLSLTVGVANAAYEPREFDVKENYVVSNPNRGEDGRNFFLNFVRAVQNKAAEIKNNIRDNIKTTGVGGGIGGSRGGGGGGVCR
jgi:transcription termination factor NusB